MILECVVARSIVCSRILVWYEKGVKNWHLFLEFLSRLKPVAYRTFVFPEYEWSDTPDSKPKRGNKIDIYTAS